MCTDLRHRIWLRSALAALVCLWLVSGPLLAASALRGAESECCCGSASACLLGGCDCGDRVGRDSSPCGGLRSSSEASHQAAVLAFGLHLGLVNDDVSVRRVDSIGQAPTADVPPQEPPVLALEPPPPRLAMTR